MVVWRAHAGCVEVQTAFIEMVLIRVAPIADSAARWIGRPLSARALPQIEAILARRRPEARPDFGFVADCRFIPCGEIRSR